MMIENNTEKNIEISMVKKDKCSLSLLACILQSIYLK